MATLEKLRKVVDEGFFWERFREGKVGRKLTRQLVPTSLELAESLPPPSWLSASSCSLVIARESEGKSASASFSQNPSELTLEIR